MRAVFARIAGAVGAVACEARALALVVEVVGRGVCSASFGEEESECWLSGGRGVSPSGWGEHLAGVCVCGAGLPGKSPLLL